MHDSQIENFIINSNQGHATHIAGTMLGQGVNPLAKGMAHEASLRYYDFLNYESELALDILTYATLISNHSWGRDNVPWLENQPNPGEWTWSYSPHWPEDPHLGLYTSDSRNADIIANSAPYHLMVRSAGNVRGFGPASGTPHYHINQSNGTIIGPFTNDFHLQVGGADGFDCISTFGASKNVLTIGAVEDIPTGYTSVSDVILADFSATGPTDDGRIKPDLVSNGVEVLSTENLSSGCGALNYKNQDGTSMAAASVSGSCILLQEHYANTHSGDFMLASTLKALLIETADEAGSSNGPDYHFGWGLMNSQRAADLIAADQVNSSTIQELSIINGQTIIIPVVVPQSNSCYLSVTIAWNDPAGTPPQTYVDPPDLMLKNDLNLRILHPTQGFKYPWTLDPANPGNPAVQTSSNFRDNVEQVRIYNPVVGTYQVYINFPPATPVVDQDFSIIINNSPEVTIYADEASSFCNGSINLIATAGLASYQWYNGQGAISGATASQYLATVSGTYYCIASHSAGCEGISNSVNISVSTELTQSDFNFSHTIGAGDYIILSDILISNGNQVVLSNADISIGPGVKIEIGDGRLALEASKLKACNDPWQGFVLNNANGQIVLIHGSRIEVALIGIDAGADALVEIHNSTFKDNGIGIRLHDGAFSNFVADGATFNGASGFYPKFGIQLENVHSAGIGNSSYDMNSFNELYAGIFSLTSNVTVQHCTFNNNQKPCLPGAFDCYTGQGSGIIAQGDPGSVFELIVGGSQSEACYFNNNTQGIFTKTNVELTATFNEYNNIGYMNQHKSYGIYAMIASNATQTVNDNLLNRLDYGVWFSNIRDAEISINNNLFNNFYSVPARQGERAITLWNTTTHPNPQLKTITYNSIQHYTQGISLTHQEVAEVKNNSFNFDRLNPSTLWYGVRVLGGRKNTISLNWMNRTGAQPDLSLGRNMHGISIERSEENDVLENDIHNLGSGIRYFGTSVINTVRCNNLIYNVDNLVLENAIIGDQGSATDASDNFWFINSNTEQTSSGHGNILGLGVLPNPSPTFFVQDLPGFNPDINGTQQCPFVCSGFTANIDNTAQNSSSFILYIIIHILSWPETRQNMDLW